MICAPSLPTVQGCLLGKLCVFTFVGNSWDSVLLVLSLYVSASAVDVFMNSNS